jgi:hypothetical protein
MSTRLSSPVAAAMLLAGVAVLDAVQGLGVRWPEPQARAGSTAAQRVPLSTGARLALARCREQVANIHDVHWAAACANPADSTARDDSPDCTLPDLVASKLNRERSLAEQQCLAEAARIAEAPAQ